MGKPTKEIKAGETFGRLTALSRFRSRKSGHAREYWRCRCACGAKISALKKDLLSGNTQSCGCLRAEGIAQGIARGRKETGIRLGDAYGRLTVVEQTLVEGQTRWRCRCSCGAEVIAHTSRLLRGMTRSCGCLRKDIAHAMGFGFTPKVPRQRGKPVAMIKCGNCTHNFDPDKDGIATVIKGKITAGVCGDCVEDATKIKLVLSRDGAGWFVYDQYSCLETRRAAG